MESSGITSRSTVLIALTLRTNEDYWSWRLDGNPRSPAWEIEARLKIQNIARMASIPVDADALSFQQLAQSESLMD
jgi:hypothetical protein